MIIDYIKKKWNSISQTLKDTRYLSMKIININCELWFECGNDFILKLKLHPYHSSFSINICSSDIIKKQKLMQS